LKQRKKANEVINVSLFFKAKDRHLANVISIESPEKAEGSVEELRKEFRQAKSRKQRVKLMRAAMIAKFRSLAETKRKNLGEKERNQFFSVAKVYQVFINEASEALKKEKK
jgi:hypothetical protein